MASDIPALSEKNSRKASGIVERYNYARISDFLEVHKVNIKVVVALITKDIVSKKPDWKEWRGENIPVERSTTMRRIMESGQTYIYKSDF